MTEGPGELFKRGGMLDAALYYRRRGWSIFPASVKNREKRPLVAWKKYQITPASEDMIRQWWARWPTAGIGLATGKVSGLVVADIDGEAGEAFLKGKDLPITPSVKTRRGHHLYYKHPGFPVKNLVTGHGLDVRGDGGFVMLPPSQYDPDFRYSWQVPLEEDLAALPHWLLEIVEGERKPGRKFKEGEVAKLLKGVVHGTRHDTATRLAGHFLGKGLPADEVYTMLTAWNSKNKPPLPEKELDRMVTDFNERIAEAHSIALQELLGIFLKWLELEEIIHIEVCLATILTTLIPGDPVWIFIVGPPGASKTEVLRSFRELKGNVFFTSKLTAQSLVSGKQEKGKPDPSLIPKLREKTLILKDFTAILGMRHDARDIVFSDLRDAYDGFIDKDFGNIGHRSYSAHFSLLAAVTPAIDRFSSLEQNLGERFLKLRLRRGPVRNKVRKAIENRAQQDVMRQELCQAVGNFFNGNFNIEAVSLPEDIKNKIISLSEFVAEARTSVHRNEYQGGIITDIPEAEIATRLGIQLSKLASGLAVIRGKNEITEDEFLVLKRIGLDSIPKKVELILEALNGQPQGEKTVEISEITGMGTKTSYRALLDLAVLGLVDGKKTQAGDRAPWVWSLSEKMQDLLNEVDPFSIL